MGIIALNFMKINVEKKKGIDGKVNINNDLVLKDVIERQLSGKNKQTIADFLFSFTVQYLTEEKIALASILLEGEVVYVDEAAKIKEVMDGWKKNKTVQKELLREIMNTAMMKCNVEGIVLSKEMNLPPPVGLPQIKE